MPNNLDLMNQVKQLADEASLKAEEFSGPMGSIHEYIVDMFGPNGLIAAYVALGILVLVLASKLIGLTLSAIKYMVVPALVLAFLVSMLSPYSFFAALPVTAAGCALLMLMKA